MEDGRMFLNEDALNLILHKVGHFANEAGRLAERLRRVQREAETEEYANRELRAELRAYSKKIDEWATYWQAARASLCRRCDKALPNPPGQLEVEIPF